VVVADAPRSLRPNHVSSGRDDLFRQAARSRIITSAHRINQGLIPDLSSPGTNSDFYFVQVDDPPMTDNLAAGQILFRAGSPGEGCDRVEDGLLKVMIVSSSGAERILVFLGPGAIVGELSTIDGLPRSATVMAMRDATLSSLSRAEFEAFSEEHPEVYKSLVKILAQRLRETDTVVAASSFLSPKGRVARTMLELAGHFGQEVGPGRIVIRQKIKQNDLAAMAGIARENVTRVLNDWQRRKVLSRLSGYYCVEDKTQLEHQAKL
jgi:CRP/FNR family transcriptional regulator, cyclic AMP receptor protein